MRKLIMFYLLTVLICSIFSCSSSEKNVKREIAENRYLDAIKCEIENRDDLYCIVINPGIFSNKLHVFRIDSHDGAVDFDKEDILAKDSKISSDGFEILFDGTQFKGRGIKSSASKYRNNRGEAALFDFDNVGKKIKQFKMMCTPAKFDSRFFKGAGVSTICD